jgi:hypothetical protein
MSFLKSLPPLDKGRETEEGEDYKKIRNLNNWIVRGRILPR